MLTVSLGIDVEPDCPPYLATQYRGMRDGLPRVLDLLDEAGVPVTCFCTGEVAERFPERVREIARRGHEVGCHGHTHRRFDRLSPDDAEWEIATSTTILRDLVSDVRAFRAPNLQFPNTYLGILERHGFRVDSSQAKYKVAYYRSSPRTTLRRVAASMTSSVLRLDAWLRNPWLLALRSPVVLFVHPWEFVDLTRERLRVDCRFRTGEAALRALREVVDLYRAHGAVFRCLRDVATST